VNQLTYIGFPMSGMRLVIVLLCVESSMGLIMKSDDSQNFENICLCSTNFGTVHSLHLNS
jgi:hypothetical protein